MLSSRPEARLGRPTINASAYAHNTNLAPAPQTSHGDVVRSLASALTYILGSGVTTKGESNGALRFNLRQIDAAPFSGMEISRVLIIVDNEGCSRTSLFFLNPLFNLYCSVKVLYTYEWV